MSKPVTKRHRYDASFKIQVVEEALRGDIRKVDICRKYSISNPILLYQWIRIFAPTPKLEDNPMKSSSSKESDEIRSLKRQLQQQALELKKEKMRADFYDEMVNVAEEMFNISIRKKVGTKQ